MDWIKPLQHHVMMKFGPDDEIWCFTKLSTCEMSDGLDANAEAQVMQEFTVRILYRRL